MSSGVLYHAMGIRGDRLVRTRFEFGAMILVIELPPEKRRCGQCGSDHVHSRGMTTRMHVPRPAVAAAAFLRRQLDH